MLREHSASELAAEATRLAFPGLVVFDPSAARYVGHPTTVRRSAPFRIRLPPMCIKAIVMTEDELDRHTLSFLDGSDTSGLLLEGLWCSDNEYEEI